MGRCLWVRMSGQRVARQCQWPESDALLRRCMWSVHRYHWGMFAFAPAFVYSALLRCAIGLLPLCCLCHASAQTPSSQPRTVISRDALPAEEQRVVTLFENAAPSVAYITTELLPTNMASEGEVSRGAGSGFLWDSLGHIVTSNHVIAAARRIFVQLDTGKSIEAVVVGRAPEYDLAVIRLSQMPVGASAGIRPIVLGESKTMRVGQRVYAIGNPFGLHRTLTQGIVSALDRELPTTGYRDVPGVIQTDAAINPGSSGGPLLDSAGRLVGMNAAIRQGQGGFAGIGFAIPVDLVNRVVPVLIARGAMFVRP